jgi:hypothetical protein
MNWAWNEPAGALTSSQRHACKKLSALADGSSLLWSKIKGGGDKGLTGRSAPPLKVIAIRLPS